MKLLETLRELSLDRLPNVMFLPAASMTESNAVGATLSALLNCGGGAVVFGIRVSDGLIEADGVLPGALGVQDFERRMQALLSPSAPVFVQECTVGELRVIVVDVPPGKDPPYSSANMIYALRNGHPELAESGEIREWVLNSGNDSHRWENRPSSIEALDGIDRIAVERAVRKAETSGRKLLDVRADTQQLLSDFGVLRYGRLLNAGLILFGRGVGRWLPQAQVRFAHFSGASADSDIVFSNVYDGPICETIDDLREYIVSHAPQSHVFVNGTGNRYDEVSYPIKAVREALVNAFAHRDYESAFGGVSVRMFKDRLEISNSGKLPECVSLHALNAGEGTLSFLVNPLIANNLYLQGFMEKLGRGSALIKKECQRVGTKVSWSDKIPGVITVLFRANAVAPVIDESINQSLNWNIVSVSEIVKIQDNLLADPGMRTFADLLINHPGLRRPGLQKLTGISRGEIQGLLNRLKSARLVVYLGSKKTGGYFFVNAREIDFDYKMIVRHCYEAEHSPERRLHGGYQPEKVRRLLERLRKDGLIRYEPSENVASLNHVDFLGFTDLGRELYLENGQIKPLFAI